MNNQQPRILSAEDALLKRNQLIEDGFCVVPGILQGEMLERVRLFTNEFLDTHAVDYKHRYQGSDFHVQAERTWAKHQDPQRFHAPLVDAILDLPEALQACAELGLELHAAWPNHSDQRRPLVLAWWRVFPFPSVPTWWTGDLPEVLGMKVEENYERTRRPSKYLK